MQIKYSYLQSFLSLVNVMDMQILVTPSPATATVVGMPPMEHIVRFASMGITAILSLRPIFRVENVRVQIPRPVDIPLLRGDSKA